MGHRCPQSPITQSRGILFIYFSRPRNIEASLDAVDNCGEAVTADEVGNGATGLFENALGEVSAQTDLTIDDDGASFIEARQVCTKRIEWHIRCALEVTVGKFAWRAHVEQ